LPIVYRRSMSVRSNLTQNVLGINSSRSFSGLYEMNSLGDTDRFRHWQLVHEVKSIEEDYWVATSLMPPPGPEISKEGLVPAALPATGTRPSTQPRACAKKDWCPQLKSHEHQNETHTGLLLNWRGQASQISVVRRNGLVVDANDVETGIRVVRAQDLVGPAVDPLGSVANDGKGLTSSRVVNRVTGARSCKDTGTRLRNLGCY
jgi:hypothetical protein